MGVRIDAETAARLARFERDAKVERLTLTRAALMAALDYFEQTGGISFPMRYAHTSSEVADMSDIQASVDLLFAVLTDEIAL